MRRASLISLLPLLYRMEHNYYANYFRLIFTTNMRVLYDLPDRGRIETLDKILRVHRCLATHHQLRDEWGSRP